MEKYLTASAFIVFDGKVLLHKHKKFAIWLPVGGHIELGESPEEAVVREIKEECGLEVDLYNPDKYIDMGDAILTIRPSFIITKPGKRKYDCIYFAQAKNPDLKPQKNESDEFGWFGAEEVDELDTNPNVKVLCKEALKIY